MYDDPEYSTNILLYLKFVCSVWPYIFARVPKATFLYVSLATNSKMWTLTHEGFSGAPDQHTGQPVWSYYHRQQC